MRVALLEPEIAGNVGAVLRLGACLGAAVDLIEPMGFAWDDRRVRRTAMDYIDHVVVSHHAGFDAFRALVRGRTSGAVHHQELGYKFRFEADEVLLFGKESAGVPAEVARACHAWLRLSLRPQVRSMSLAMATSLALADDCQTRRSSTPVSRLHVAAR